MGVLSNLEPASVFYYFEEICGIPHGSGNTKRIADYCEQFAARRGLHAAGLVFDPTGSTKRTRLHD